MRVGDGCGFIAMTGIISMLPAWLTHVIYCIQNELWVFLLAGGLVWPIGVIHGFGLWMGVF